jgi:membrane peptidoglycan carboxypeptidase
MRAQRAQAVRWRIARRHLNRRRSHRLRWALGIALTLLLAVAGGSGIAAAYFLTHLPSADAFHIHYPFQNARIFDSRGGLITSVADPSGDRRFVEPLQARRDTADACRNGVNRIPLVLQNATIATEDATFYGNPGFDPLSIVRAAYQNLSSGQIVSGASTITQQLVRLNHLVSTKDTINRKLREVELAYEISQKFSKRELLWYYLNSVPYGNLANGAQAAAETYFHRLVCSVDLAQAAFLAGLPRAPSLYDPIMHRATAITRMREVLGLMRKHGYLRKGQISAALAEARSWTFTRPQTWDRYPQWTRYVLNQIQTMPNMRKQLYDGLDIYTTLDPRLQDLAQATVTKQINDLVAQHVTDGALVSIDVRPQHYGWIMAMVGSADFHATAGQINMAVSPRQPGSSMKPFNYIYAFEHGVSPGTTVVDSPIQLPDPNDTLHHGWYVPINYDHLFHGQITVRQALANSLNIPAVKVEYYVTGSNHVAETAYRFGMRSLYKDNPGVSCSVCYAVTLGGLAQGTRLLEETAAYGVFATSGWTVPPVAIWKIVRRDTHQVLFCSAECPSGAKPAAWLTDERKHVLDAAHAYEMTNVLSDNNARCTVQVCEFGLNSALVLTHPAAAKTGTTNAFTDNWTVGYTPQLVTGVWVGNADRTPMVNVIGVTGAAPIWQTFMEGAFSTLNLPSVPFVAPPSVVSTGQCMMPGSPATTPGAAPTPGYRGIGVTDLYVQGDQLPLCRIPERGSMPVSCAQYPHPLPLGWQCINATGSYQYYYGTQPYTTSAYPGTQPSTTYPGTGNTFGPSTTGPP